MLWKDVFALSSCTLGFLRAQDLACCRTHLLSGLFEVLNKDPSLKCECTRMCSGQRLAGAHLSYG